MCIYLVAVKLILPETRAGLIWLSLLLLALQAGIWGLEINVSRLGLFSYLCAAEPVEPAHDVVGPVRQ